MARTTARTDARDAGQSSIGRSTRVRGRVSGDGDLVVEGTIEGDVSVSGDLTVAEGGTLTSNVEANAVTVRGQIEGDVRARGAIRIEAGARVRGDVSGGSFALEDGAEFAGDVDLSFDLPPELGGGTTRSSGNAGGRR